MMCVAARSKNDLGHQRAMRGSLALRPVIASTDISLEVECIMKKVLILPAIVLALSAHAVIAQAQGKGPDNDSQTKTVSSDHSTNARKEQAPQEQTKEQAETPTGPQTTVQPDKKETDKPVASSTASVTTLEEPGDSSHTATTDAPVKTTTTVPVAIPSPSSTANSSTPSTRTAAKAVPASKDAAKKGKAAKGDKSAPAKNDSTPQLNPTATAPTSTSPNSTAPASTAPSLSSSASSSTASDVPSKVAPASSSTASPASGPPLPTSIYRIGTGDVLDIRLLNTSARESTLYTVMSGGLLEYPLAGVPFQVSGMTTEEIRARLAASVKVYDNPQFVVSVREYASHSIIITGLVSNPGPRILRREAMPLYVVLAEAQPNAEAARATIMRAGSQNMTVDLADSTATSTLVQSGDVIKVMAAPPAAPQFYFIGGQVNAPGQKDFHAGLTLTQSILASGGISRFANSKVRVSRQGADGRLITTEYNLKQIEEGKVPDPTLQAGDRVEVGRGHW
jgi:protein involved in polysaccharide export with SLBB domain